MSAKSEKKRIREELLKQYQKDNPPEGYDGMSERVNASYRRTGDVRLTMKDTGLPFDIVWAMVGFKDMDDFGSTGIGKS